MIVLRIGNRRLQNLSHVVRDPALGERQVVQCLLGGLAADQTADEVQLPRAGAQVQRHRAGLVLGKGPLCLGLAHPYLLDAFLSAAWPGKVRVGANSPNLWPTMFSVTSTGRNFWPL